MRLSTVPTDIGYRKDAEKYRVTLDGVLVDNCYVADEELGEVWCYGEGEGEGVCLHGEVVIGILH